MQSQTVKTNAFFKDNMAEGYSFAGNVVQGCRESGGDEWNWLVLPRSASGFLFGRGLAWGLPHSSHLLTDSFKVTRSLPGKIRCFAIISTLVRNLRKSQIPGNFLPVVIDNVTEIRRHTFPRSHRLRQLL
jgi:hypothetical protein